MSLSQKEMNKIDEIKKFMRKKGTSRSCNSCGNNLDDVSHSEGELTAWSLNDYKDSYGCGEQVIQTIIIECNHCANIQLFSEHSIRREMDKDDL